LSIPDESEGAAASPGNDAIVGQESAKKMQQVLTKLYQQGYINNGTIVRSEYRLSTFVSVKA
jgi:ribosomal protein S8